MKKHQLWRMKMINWLKNKFGKLTHEVKCIKKDVRKLLGLYTPMTEFEVGFNDPSEQFKREFQRSFKEMSQRAYDLAAAKGFWDNQEADCKLSEQVALLHSECSELLEAIRKDNPPDDKIKDFSSAEAELADLVIRVMNLAWAKGWDVGGAILAKHKYNVSRPFKHGKKF